MKQGKVWTPVLKRSVFNIVNFGSSKSAAKLRLGEDAADFLIEGEFVVSSAMVEGNDPELALYAVHGALNNIYAGGGIPFGISMTLNLREREEEKVLKQWIRSVDRVCREMSVRILGGHTTVSAGNGMTVLAITAFGKKRGIGSAPILNSSYDGCRVIMTKYAGIEGTIRLLLEHYEELKTVYTDDFLKRGFDYTGYLSVREEANAVFDYINDLSGNHLMTPVLHDVSEGGIMAALWEISEFLLCGLEIDMKKILIKQLTIEVTEFLDLNPYMLKSCGSLLIVTDQPDGVLEQLKKQGIPAADIGKITNDKECILRNGDEVRFIEPFRGDSINLK